MIAVRCQACARRFALFCLQEGDGCPFCGARQLVRLSGGEGVCRTVDGARWRVMDDPDGTTPGLPPVTTPPALERVVITERTVEIARDLVRQALGETPRESEPCD